MSFNLIYNDRGVDYSGLGAGIARGLEQAAILRRKQEEIVQSRLDDFEKNYDKDKLRTNDVGLFTSAFDNYRKVAVELAKLNRGGANAEKLAVASKMKDAALREMNDIWAKSTAAANLLKERTEYRKLMASKGYQTPDNVNDEIMSLDTNSIKDIDLKKFKSPYDTPIYANDKDYQFLYSSLKAARPFQNDIEDKSKSKEIDVQGYGKFVVPYMKRVSGTNIEDSIVLASNALKARPALYNSAIKDYNDFMQKLSIPETEKDPVLASEREMAKKKYQSIMDATDNKYTLTPELYLVSQTPALTKSTKDIGLDRKSFDIIESELKRKLGEKRYELAKKSLGQQFAKFGYLQEKDMDRLFLTPGAENIPSVAKAAAKKGVNLNAVRDAQKKAKLDAKGKNSNSKAASLLSGLNKQD